MRSAPTRLVIAAVCLGLLATCGSAATTPPPGPTGSPGSACFPATTPVARDWNERVWYEVFVRSFADGNGDGTGDFKGLTERLDYLNDGDPATTSDLGVGGLWLMPITESPSYHGYDVTDYRTVEADYGTNADFEAFLDSAHRRGIKVIVDLVMNHTSSLHPWFADAQSRTAAHEAWYVWSDSFPGWRGPWGDVAWHQLGDRWYYGVFGDDRTTEDETILAVVNLGDRPVRDYRLSLERGPLCGPVTASIIATAGGDPATPVSAPTVTAGGGLDEWVPVPELAPRAGYLIALRSPK